MTIAYDCYPLMPQEFASTIAPYVFMLESAPDGYAQLRSAALALFDCDENVQRLASNYGGWDRESLIAETDEAPAFWLVLFLYAHCSRLSQSQDFSNMSYVPYIPTWSKEDNYILTFGKYSFEDFARQYLYQTDTNHLENIPDFWKYFHPPCMLGHVGWLDIAEMQKLLDKLAQLEPRIENLESETISHQIQHYFQDAIQHNYCLCIIQSA